MNNNNFRYNMHKTSAYWQEWKLSQPGLNAYLKSVVIGMILSDAGLHKIGKNAYIKFEQSRVQYGLIHNLYFLFNNYTFMEHIGVRFNKANKSIKSFYFKTYSHPTFTELWELFHNHSVNKTKDIQPGFITTYVDDIALAYWIMGDGTLHKRDNVLTLHTENFNEETNNTISRELNSKFNLHSTIGTSYNKERDKTYYMIHIPHRDKDVIINLVSKHIIPDMQYKIAYKL